MPGGQRAFLQDCSRQNGCPNNIHFPLLAGCTFLKLLCINGQPRNWAAANHMWGAACHFYSLPIISTKQPSKLCPTRQNGEAPSNLGSHVNVAISLVPKWLHGVGMPPPSAPIWNFPGHEWGGRTNFLCIGQSTWLSQQFSLFQLIEVVNVNSIRVWSCFWMCA